MDLLRTAEFRVGLLVTVVLVLLGVMVLQVSEDPTMHGRTRRAFFRVRDATGLIKSSPVKMAGIPIGIIKSIQLEDGIAKVEIVVRKEIPLNQESSAEIRANGILGDRYVEVLSPNPAAEPLAEGGEIQRVKSAGSMDQMMTEIGKVTQNLNDVAESLKAATTGSGSTNTPLGRIVGNIEVVTSDLREFTHDNKGKISQIVDNLHATTETLDDLINDPSEDGFRAGWTSAVKSLKKFDHSMQNIQEITDKVNSGKGTIGQLINDDQTITELNSAVTGVNQMLGTATKIQTNLDFHSEYLAANNLYKTYLGLRIQPGLDRYYEVQIVDDPKGVVETTRTETTSSATGVQPTIDEKKTFKNRVKFTALFAKNFYDFTVKGGLIESSGGIGIDYHFLRRKFRFSTEAFDVNDSAVRLRSSLRYSLVRGVYVVGGADDYLTKNTTSYFGAGLDLTNDDLKALLGKFSL